MTSRTEGIRWPVDERRDAPCPVCGAPGPKAVLLEVPSPFPGRDLRRLLDCGACPTRFFADHEPPPETYEDNAASVKFYVHQSGSIEHMIGPLLRFRLGPGTRFAEIGCGFGFALDFARAALGWHARGIDDSTAADMGARALGVDIAPALFQGPSSFGGETFDVVLASEVLEHIPDPHAFARAVAALLAPRGTAIVTTPNADVIRREHPPSELLRVLSPGFHHVFFTAATLRAVLERAGFTHVQVEEKFDNLMAYASRVPLELEAAGDPNSERYRAYLAARGAAEELDPDVRLGFAYRRFKALVNVAAWDEARAAFATACEIVQRRYGVDLETPDVIAVIEPIPWDVPMNQDLANLHFERFMAAAPGCIVGLLFFRGSLALGTGLSREAAAFFRAAGATGNVARSLRLTMAHADGEINDLFHQSFLLEALALADVAPEESVRAVDRIVDGTPPPDVLPPLWSFTASEREWLLGTVFARLVDRGHLAAADKMFDRLCDALAPYGIDLTEPASIGVPTGASSRAAPAPEATAVSQGPMPRGLARVLSARGIVAMHRGHHALACAYFRRAIDGWTARDRSADDDALLTRTRVHLVLALTGLDPQAALDALLAPSSSGSTGSSQDHASERVGLVGAVFAALVNQGAGSLASRLVRDVEAALGSEDGSAPDPATLLAHPGSALDVAFCRAMLALNHEQAPVRAAAWFRSVFEAARTRGLAAGPPGAIGALVRNAKYHEALALVDAGEWPAALTAIEHLGTSPAIAATSSDGPVRGDASAVLGVFVRLVHRGGAEVAAGLLPEVETAVGALAGSPPAPGHLATRPDGELDAAFCRAMLAFNHEAAPARAAAWFGSVFEAIADQARRGAASASSQALLWQAGYHRALSLLDTDDLPATIEAIDGMRTPPPGIPRERWPGTGGEMARVIAGAFVRAVNRREGALPARLAGDVEGALRAAADAPPDSADLASRPDWALDAAFCRAMLALNHEAEPARAAAWFHSAYEAALARWRQHRGGPTAGTRCWTARYHEALARARGGDRAVAASIARELLARRSPGMPRVPRALRRSGRALLRGA